jgi:LuxR family maltose regulon positive regulatory protein
MNVDDRSTLIQTKFHRPILPVDLVARPQLTDWLDERRNSPLTLVSAPAGYGKSTLISSWLDTCKYPHTWLTLDKGDNDLTGFLAYFLEAIRIIFPEAVKHSHALLNAYIQPPTKEIAISLVNEINQLDQFFVLVLDDFEVIQEHLIHDFLNEFLLHPPRGFHLVLCTRTDPFLSIQKLRAQSQLNEIRAQDLRFSVEESVTFLQNMLGTTVDIDTITKLDQQSEGWVTGLRLAALALRHRVGKRRIDLTPTASNQYVLDYLMTEILNSQTPVISEWLLKASILARFNAGLCEAVCIAERERTLQPEKDSQLDGDGFLKWLIGSNLFTIPLDDHNRWVRYHNLFREFLQNELVQRYDRAEISALHIQASAWFAGQGMIDDALHHALAADDFLVATRLVEQNVRQLQDEDQWQLLEKWIARLPDDIVQEHPKLMLAKVWLSFQNFALQAIPPILETIEKILETDADTQALWGEVDFFRGHDWYWQGQSARSLASLQHALERIPVVHHMARGEAELFWGLANQMLGQEEEAVQQLNQWLYYDQAPHPGRQTNLLGSLAFIHLLSGELDEAARVIQEAQEMATKVDNIYVKAFAFYLEGMIHYCQNDLENAARCFAFTAKNRYFLHIGAAVDSLAGLALTYQALEQTESANATMAQLHEFVQEINQPGPITIACSCQAHLSLLRSDPVSAKRWIATADLNTDNGIMFYWLEIPRLTACRVLTAQGTPASLAEAVQKLEIYEQRNINEHNTHQLIEILLLQTVAYQKQSQPDQALAALNRALTLAEPGSWIRPFVELGNIIFELLTRLVDQQGTTKYLSKILAAFEPVLHVEIPEPAQAASQLIEPLTNREFEILELLGKRLTNKEIAAKLHISVGTVQQHLNHIYAKLDVRGRRQAIVKANELALLPTRN